MKVSRDNTRAELRGENSWEQRHGQSSRRGLLQEGDRVQITDPKGKLHTVMLVRGGKFQSARGTIYHDQLLGKPDGQIVHTEEGKTFQVIRPLLADYTLSMPRGAAIVYPKDASQIVQMGDIFPAAHVLEAGVGSGALSISLLDAIGEHGSLTSVEKREDFAEIAQANVDLWFGGRHPAWNLKVADLAEQIVSFEPCSFDRVVLDLLDPWSYLSQVKRVLLPGGVLICYVATVTQMSRLTEDIRTIEGFTEPQIWESTIRPWHVQGLAVRPEHRMVAHTGFLLTCRRLGTDQDTHQMHLRPAPAAANQPGAWSHVTVWDEEGLGLRRQSPKKTRRIRRDLTARVNRWIE